MSNMTLGDLRSLTPEWADRVLDGKAERKISNNTTLRVESGTSYDYGLSTDFTETKYKRYVVRYHRTDIVILDGPILYLTGKVRSGDLAATLRSGGFSVDRVELYDAVAATHIPSPTKQMCRAVAQSVLHPDLHQLLPLVAGHQ